MSRPILIAPLLALIAGSLLAGTAAANATLPGINIRWDNCFADGGVMNKSFACNTNSGAELAVMSVQLDTEMSFVSGVEIRLSIESAAATLPAWWEFMNSGSCRLRSALYIPAPVLPEENCADWGQFLEVGGFPSTGYHLNEIGPGTAVAFMVAAVPQSQLQTLAPAQEYVVGAFRVDHFHTVGAGACGGCNTPVCILFTSLKVTTSRPPAADRLLTQGANGVGSQFIHWQNGQLTNLQNSCTGTFNCTTHFDCLAAAAVPTRPSTWGAVKSLYR